MNVPFCSRETSEGPRLGPFKVLPTLLRFGVVSDYVVQVNQKLKVNLGRYVIVSKPKRKQPVGKPESKRPDVDLADIQAARAVLAKVTVCANLSDKEIRLDQTLREALFMNAGDKVYLYKKVGGSPCRLLDWIFKPKRLWAYVYRSYRRDMEKSLCGMSAMTMRILGLSSRDRLRVEYVFFDSKVGKFKIGVATPTVFELPAEDVKHTINEVTQIDAVKDFIFPTPRDISKLRLPDAYKNFLCPTPGDISRLRLPFVLLDLELRLTLANENLKSWRIRQESESTFTDKDLRKFPILAPVRLSPSLPFILQSRSVFHTLSAFIGVLGTVIALSTLGFLTGIVIGGVCLVIWLPMIIYWDIKRRVG